MHYTCNLEYGVHEGKERIPLKLRERLAELIWWPLVVARGHGGPWPKLGPTGFMAKRVSKRDLVIFGSKEIMAKIGSGGPNCGLGPTWPWGLGGWPLWPPLTTLD